MGLVLWGSTVLRVVQMWWSTKVAMHMGRRESSRQRWVGAWWLDAFIQKAEDHGLKTILGIYGFLRFSIPMFPESTLCSTPFIYTLSMIA
ncbi:hypothetical protein RJ639_006327 [Escallonia herrerae]|uniref:Secreted protein n=1 Tax=Escallonia herrerae TaxID=1293975 RepID=A0AA88VX64_9ASTE|nr:hypothetical protein RJ639_006327 [Escallonia herrerae]